MAADSIVRSPLGVVVQTFIQKATSGFGFGAEPGATTVLLVKDEASTVTEFRAAPPTCRCAPA